MKNNYFCEIREKVIQEEKMRQSIGTLSEKSLHAILKNYYEPDKEKQEVKVENYIADIFTGSEIIEIQTGQFHRMRQKLNTFLPLSPVTIVYPIPRHKWLLWIDEDTGEISERRKSPKIGNPYLIFPELYKIKAFLKDDNLKIKLAILDVEEYKIQNGYGKNKKIRASKYDRIPIELIEEIDIERVEDYMQFLPIDLEDSFTVKDFSKTVRISEKIASITLNILFEMGVIDRIGKKGNAYIYKVNL